MSSTVYLRLIGGAGALDEGGNTLELNGLPQPVDADRVELLKAVPGLDFEEVSAKDAEAEIAAANPEASDAEVKAAAAAAEKAEAEAARRGAYYGAQSQTEIDALDGIEPDTSPIFDEDDEEDEDGGDVELDLDLSPQDTGK